MNEKRILDWLHRVLIEKTVDTKKIQERISILNHQIQNFKKMPNNYKEAVLTDLIEDLKKYGWKEAEKEIKTFLKKE